MSKIILISQPEERVLNMLDAEFFNSQMQDKNFAYLPCQGDNPNNQKYIGLWKDKVEKNRGVFHYVDNSKNSGDFQKEREVIQQSDYLMIPGGNTFMLLNNLKQSGLFDAVKSFFQKNKFNYLGMSAGAIILAPTIESANNHGFSFGFDENDVGLTDLNALNIIDFEPIVHFDPEQDQEALEEYKSKSPFKVKPITNDEVVIL